MKIRNLLLPVAVLLAFSSCAVHSGIALNSTALSEANFDIVERGTGHSTVTYVFGIGGLNRKAIVEAALKDLRKKHPLENYETYANMTVDFKSKYIFIYRQVTCTVGADVVKFEKE